MRNHLYIGNVLLLVLSCVSGTFYVRNPGRIYTVASPPRQMPDAVGQSWMFVSSRNGPEESVPTWSAPQSHPVHAGQIIDPQTGPLSGRWKTVLSGEGDHIAGIAQTLVGDGILAGDGTPGGLVIGITDGNAGVGGPNDHNTFQQTISATGDGKGEQGLMDSSGRTRTINEEMSAAIGSGIFRSTNIGAPAGTVIAEGDIMWNIGQYHSIQHELRTQGKTTRPASNPHLISLWPRGIVPIRISSGGFTRGQKRRMQAAMNRISRDTCVCFRIITRAQAAHGEPHIRIRNRRRCASFIGRNIRRSGKQRYQDLLMAPTCRSTRVFTHQLLHALGLYHEHTTPSRNRDLRIVYNNMAREHWFHMNRIPWIQYSNIQRTTPYDFLSLMHYGPRAFSKNGRMTISPRRNTVRNLARIGRATAMSSADKRRIRRMYNCLRVPPARPTCPQYPYRFP